MLHVFTLIHILTSYKSLMSLIMKRNKVMSEELADSQKELKEFKHLETLLQTMNKDFNQLLHFKSNEARYVNKNSFVFPSLEYF